MRSVLISQIINAVYFAKKADSEGLVPGFFANNEIPLRTIALIVTSIENCIDEWKLGENKEISFTRKEYNVKFEAHLLSLHNWETVSRKGSNSLQKYQRDLFACGRSFAGMSRIPVTDSSLTTESSFSAADFEADEVRASVS
ncbi:hypothetical protein C8J56DRAFT_918628 [Mycena floridula]|nr:hypothetical protein C8J56DRAFT_538677 [Mycena floridula]KAJ7596913.1 hypothetical protein C8J56DRAFT_918628 [Mycena floridula]